MGFDTDSLLWERRRRACAPTADVEATVASFTKWCSKYVWIEHPRGRRLLQLRDAQQETIRTYLSSDKTIVLKARQIGFTTVTMQFCLWMALMVDDYKIIVLSRKEDDAKAALAKADMAYQNLPEGLKAVLPRRLDNNARSMTFDNGSQIECHPSANNPARGRTASLMILDEWAFMPNPDEAWASVRPVVDIGGKLVALSTANGWGNLFHEMYVAAKLGQNDMRNLFFPWHVVPERDDDWYAEQQRSMPEWMLHQEYPSDDEECFVKSGNTVFDIEGLKRQRLIEPEIGQFVSQTNRPQDYYYRPKKGGLLRVFDKPKQGRTYVIGSDTSAGLRDGDFGAAHVLCVQDRTVAAVLHGSLDPDVLSLQVARLGWWYRRALLGVEANNHGIAVLKELQRLKYPNLYYRRSQGQRFEKVSIQVGWWTSKVTKPLMIDELAAALRDGVLAVRDGPTVTELMHYVRDEKGLMHGSPHDDRVMSLAIAWQMLAHGNNAEPDAEPDEYDGSFQQAMDLFERLDSQQKAWVIGRTNVRGGAMAGV